MPRHDQVTPTGICAGSGLLDSPDRLYGSDQVNLRRSGERLAARPPLAHSHRDLDRRALEPELLPKPSFDEAPV